MFNLKGALDDALTTTGTPLNPTDATFLEVLLRERGPLDLDCLSYACLECGSIGASADRAGRDTNFRYLDLACCDRATTVTFVTIGMGV